MRKDKSKDEVGRGNGRRSYLDLLYAEERRTRRTRIRKQREQTNRLDGAYYPYTNSLADAV